MADKAATIYIIDVGKTTGDFHQGRDESDLDFTLRYVWDKITATIATNRKTDCIGIIAFRTDGTDNEQSHDPSYSNIRVLSPIKQFLMADVRSISSSLVPSSTNDGDSLSALVIGIEMMKKYCRHLKYRKNIYLFTDGRGETDFDGYETILQQMIENNINLTVLGVDFDDEEFGFVEDPKEKGEIKRENERGWKAAVRIVDGVYGTMREAVEELEVPRIKPVRPQAVFRGKLTLGDPEIYESAITIDVERYPRTMVAKPPSASRVVEGPVGGEEGEVKTETQLEDRGSKEFQGVKNAFSYKVKDENAPTGTVDVERAQLDKGYKYGRTIVPIAESDLEVVNLATKAGMEIVSFFETRRYKRFFHMSQTCITVHQRGNHQAAMALSSFIHALYELDCYALVRFVKKDNEPPKMLLLAPSIEPEFEGLIDVELPFHEDIRPYKFPPLNTVKTTAGKTLDKHRFIPTSAMNSAMSSYVDSMLLTPLPTSPTSSSSSDSEEDPIPTDSTFSPTLHRINAAIKYRAANPTKPLPPIPEILTRFSQPPSDLIARSREPLKHLISTCDVKPVPPKTKARGFRRDATASKPQSGIDIDALLGITPQTRRTRPISPQNAIPDYKRRIEALEDAVANGEDVEDLEGEWKKAAKEMFEIAKELIKESLSDANYEQAVAVLKCVRDEMKEIEELGVYNEEFRRLKGEVLGRGLGGDRFDVWVKFRSTGVGLVVGEEETGGVTEEEARAFWDPSK